MAVFTSGLAESVKKTKSVNDTNFFSRLETRKNIIANFFQAIPQFGKSNPIESKIQSIIKTIWQIFGSAKRIGFHSSPVNQKSQKSEIVTKNMINGF